MRSAAVLAILILAAAGCSQPSDPPADASATGDPSTTAAVPPSITSAAPTSPQAPTPSSPPVQWATIENATIRPGATQLMLDGSRCTLNFLFADDSNATAYMGTAAHCTETEGERVMLDDGREIGTVVYDSDIHPGADANLDFTLFQLDDGLNLQANPSVIWWGGPVGVATPDDLSQLDELVFHGNGLLLGDFQETQDRSGYLVGWNDTFYHANLPAVNGDSGSPLIHYATGKALGVISHYGVAGLPPTTDEGPLLTYVLNQLHAAGFKGVQLATAPQT